MKYKVHVPTEQYGFIEAELEGEAHDAEAVYQDIKRAQGGAQGLPAREFCAFMDSYLTTGTPPEHGLEQWEKMNTVQKVVVNEVKKCLKRINK